jgi:arylformamidase
VVDVSWPLEAGVTAFKDAPERAYTVDRFRDWPKDHARESRFTMCLHTGTHIDAPAHFLEGAPQRHDT